MSIPVAIARRVTHPPSVDSPAGWGCAELGRFDGFKVEWGEATQRTEAFLGYDGTHLYLAFTLQEEQIDQLRTDTTRRTRDIDVQTWINKDDSIQVVIDPLRDGVNYFHFLVNPAGRWMTSRGKGSPDFIESDFDWAPSGWRFQAEIGEESWIARMSIPASDLGLERFHDGQLLGIEIIRERTPEPHETTALATDTLADSTQWTSHLSYEPSKFGVLALGELSEEPGPFEVEQWQGPARPMAREDVCLLPVEASGAAGRWKLRTLAGRDYWAVHTPLEANPGLEESRLAEFRSIFGWRLYRDITKNLDARTEPGDEWTWWVPGLSDETARKNPWNAGISREKLEDSVFTLEGRRYTIGQCLPPYRDTPEIAEQAFGQLVEKFGERFIGHVFLEWDSDIWSVATGMREVPDFDEYPDETPGMSGTKESEARTLRREFDLFRKLTYDRVVAMNCWRCIDHYGLEWGGRAALIEMTGAGNPSSLTQLAFARGAARQYGAFFMTYHATFLGSDYTKYEGGLEFIPTYEGVYAAGPDSGPSAFLYKRQLFTGYLAGTTVQLFEVPHRSHVMPADSPGKYKLSPHGDAFADLLEYDRRYPDRGVPYQPVALLLDYLHGFSPPHQTCAAVGRSGMQTWFSVPYDRGDHQVYQTFWTIFPWCRQSTERNGYPLTNTPFGDIFDVLLANPPSGAVRTDVLRSYRAAALIGSITWTDELREHLLEYVRNGGALVVNSLHYSQLPTELQGGDTLFESGGVQVTRKPVGQGAVIATPDSDLLDQDNKALPILGEILATLSRELSPVQVSGDIQYHFLRTQTGWLIALLNNKGIVHVSPNPPILDPKAAAEVKLVYPGTVTGSIERLSGEAVSWQHHGSDSSTRVTVPPGGVRIVEIS